MATSYELNIQLTIHLKLSKIIDSYLLFVCYLLKIFHLLILVIDYECYNCFREI